MTRPRAPWNIARFVGAIVGFAILASVSGYAILQGSFVAKLNGNLFVVPVLLMSVVAAGLVPVRSYSSRPARLWLRAFAFFFVLFVGFLSAIQLTIIIHGKYSACARQRAQCPRTSLTGCEQLT